MFNLLCELHFWSQNEGIVVDSSDFGAFVYQDGKASSAGPVKESKKLYSERRGTSFHGRGKHTRKLRDSLAELEEALAACRLVRLGWKCPSVVRAVFENGLQSYVRINARSGLPEEFVHDKFLVGKLPSIHVSDVAVSSQQAVFAFTDNRVTRALATRPTFGGLSTKKLSSLDVKLSNIELAAGPSGRRLDKSLSFNMTGDVLLMWWKCGRDEVYPWSPQVRTEDRANVHVYSLSDSTAFELVCYYRTKYDPVDVRFSRVNLSTIHTIQQRVDDEGLVTLEWENARLEGRALHCNYSLSLQLPTHVASLSLSPKEDKLLATCIDGSILVADSYGNVGNRHRTDLIPSLASWHPDGALVIVGDNKGRLQWFDAALAPTTCQILNHEGSSTTVDVGSYFKYQPNLVGLHWNRRPAESNDAADIPDDCSDFLLLEFEKGPLVLLKLIGRGLTADTVVLQYLRSGAFASANNLLHTLDWEVDAALALSTLQSAVSFLMRRPLSSTTEAAIETSLGCFLSPLRPIPETVASELTDSVLDLAKRYFHLLVRYRCFEKAFRLAIDLGRDDLFIDLHYACREAGNHVMAAAARDRAEDIGCSSASDESESTDCSHSQSTSNVSSENNQDDKSSSSSTSTSELETKILPPLPIMSPLESARNKVCYSSILQQHNYRRHPSTVDAQPSAAATLLRPNCRLPSQLINRPSRGLNGSHFADYAFVDDDTCLIHHPNTPSSRAPLQFNSRLATVDTPVDDQLTDVVSSQLSSVVISDPTVALPYSLKVANARRRPANTPAHAEVSERLYDNPVARSPLMQSCLGPPHNHQRQGELPGRELLDRVRYEPVGGRLLPPPLLPCDISSNNSAGSLLMSNNFGGLADARAVPNNVRSAAESRSVSIVSLPPIPTDSLQFKSSFARNCQSSSTVGQRPTSSALPNEPPIIASAETEDGKIKVVHFGLV